jgi:hypothetical protein
MIVATRDGAIIFADLIGKLDMLRVACDKTAGSSSQLRKRVKDYARYVENAAVDRPSRWSWCPLRPLKGNQVASGERCFEQTLQPQLRG